MIRKILPVVALFAATLAMAEPKVSDGGTAPASGSAQEPASAEAKAAAERAATARKALKALKGGDTRDKSEDKRAQDEDDRKKRGR